LLLQCNDQIKFLVDTALDEEADTQDQKDLRADLITQLSMLSSAGLVEEVATAVPEAVSESAVVGAQVWTISARFGPDTFRNGMDPLSIARYLGNMGRIVSVQCGIDTVPPLVNINPESCHLSFTMELESSASRDDIEGAFSFVMDDCELDVQSPETPGQKLVRAIESIPETPRLGDMLVQVGAVSPDKLAQVLSTQHHTGGMPAVPKAKIGDLLETQAGVPPEAVAAALGKQQKIRESTGAGEDRYIRVQADRLDAVINLLGELVIAGAGATMLARESRQINLLEANLHMNSLIEEIRNGTLACAWFSGETFSRFAGVAIPRPAWARK
jgi:two-component system chemotaxis sensor kinase CheA